MYICERCGDLCRVHIALKSVTKRALWCLNCFLSVAVEIISSTGVCPECRDPTHEVKCLINLMTFKEEEMS